MKFLSVDPGLTNAAVVLVDVDMDLDGSPRAEILWKGTGDFKTDKTNPDPEKASSFFREVSESLKALAFFKGFKDLPEIHVVVEYQPPIFVARNCAIVRWNTWVEAYAMAYFKETHNFPVHYVYPANVKTHFEIASKSYVTNKNLAVIKAKTFSVNPRDITSDHYADAILNAIYFYLKSKS